ncbi:hypothetical protein LXL04_010140 [Taraxacum kok-saghyz]
MEFNSVHHLFSKLSFLCSSPLFSTIVTLYTLILLYIPSLFLSIALSPVLNSTGIILISLLRLGADKLENESRVFYYRENESVGKEFGLESRVLDCEENRSEFILCSRLAPESDSMESRFLDLVAENQTHVELGSKFGLDLEWNETHMEFEHDMELESDSMESSQVIEEGGPKYEPKSGLESECNQTHVGFDHSMELESNSMESSQMIEDLECNSIESSQLIEEGVPTYDPKSILDLKCNQTHVEFEHDVGLESNSIESSQAIKGNPKMETNIKQVDTTMAFLEWNMRTPLEIIYEAYEGEEEEYEDDEESNYNENHEVSNNKHDVGIERYPSLLMYYPDSETDSSSGDDFPMNEKWERHESVFFKWEDEEEEEREELIEISLDHYGKRSIEFCHVEEDNLIEIDLFN